MEEFSADFFVDITDVECPVTFIKAQAAVEKIDRDQVLAIRLNGGRPAEHLPRTLQCEGHALLGKLDNGDGTFTAFIRKGDLPPAKGGE